MCNRLKSAYGFLHVSHIMYYCYEISLLLWVHRDQYPLVFHFTWLKPTAVKGFFPEIKRSFHISFWFPAIWLQSRNDFHESNFESFVVCHYVMLMQMMKPTCNKAQHRVKTETLVRERLQQNAKASSPKWEGSSSPGNGERRSQVKSSLKHR